MTKNIQIRAAQLEDAQEIRQLLFQLGYENSIHDLVTALTDEDRRDALFVCVGEHNILAVMSLISFDYFPSLNQVCRITAIVVDEVARGSGVGNSLLDFAKQWARDNQCSTLEVTTSLVRLHTQRYYKKQGFNKQGYRYVMPV